MASIKFGSEIIINTQEAASWILKNLNKKSGKYSIMSGRNTKQEIETNKKIISKIIL